MLDTLFLYVLDMTAKGSLVILAVLLLRLCLRKAPKVFSYALWGVVLLRLLCPFAIQLPVSMLPEMEPVPQTYRFESDPITITDAGSAVNQVMVEASAGTLNADQIYVDVPSSLGGSRPMAATLWEICVMAGQYLWLAGLLAMLLHTLIHYILLRRKLVGAMRLQDNIWLADHIDSPFVMGILKPKIYLPSTLADGELGYIIAHEKHHIRRRDPAVKFLAFVALTLHWFNPLVWLAYVLFSKDMEMSCDEAVIKKLGPDIRADYAASLLNLATGRRIAAFTPLAFGEGDTKSRIQNLAKWKKPVAWIVTLCALVCIVAAACLLTDPTPQANNVTETTQPSQPQPGGTSPEEVMKITLSHAGVCHEGEFYAAALNSYQMAQSSIRHVPIFRFRSHQELEDFTDRFGKFFSLNQSHEEVPSFNAVAQRFDDTFFEHKNLVLVYLVSNSTYRYGVDSIYCASNQFTVHVKRTDDSQVYNAESIGWFLTLEVPATMLSGVEQFDADVTGPSGLGGYQPSVEVENTDGNTVLRVTTYMPRTNFYRISDSLKEKIAADWRLHDSLTPLQQASSSHLFGWITLRHDTWQQCEEDLGVTIPNPIGNISWLEKTDVYGGIATDPAILHTQLTVRASDPEKRTVERATLEAGYRAEGVRVVISAFVHAEDVLFTTGYGADGKVEFTRRETTTGSGLPVMILTSDQQVDYSSLDAWWVVDNVYYSLHLVGEKGQDAHVQAILEKLLNEI